MSGLKYIFLLLLCFVVSFQFNEYQKGKKGRGLASSSKILDSSGYRYNPKDTSCDGFPRLEVETIKGTCLGLVLPRLKAKDKETDRDFIKPRTIIQIPNVENEFLIADMGGWGPNNGRLFWLKKHDGEEFGIKLVKMGLNNPHGLRYPGDGYFYLGEKEKITRFKFVDGEYFYTSSGLNLRQSLWPVNHSPIIYSVPQSVQSLDQPPCL